jgi:hypothetical protein
MRARILSLGLPLVVACGGGSSSAPPPSTEATPTSAPAASSVAAPASTPAAPVTIPTGGSVLVGDINAPKGFNPKPTIEGLSSALVDCYNKARAVTPDLHGKVTLRIQINEGGAVLSVDADPGGHANDPGLVGCVNDVMKASAHFPKPGGTATVMAPLVFRP